MSAKECTPILRRFKRESLLKYLKIVYSAINDEVFQNSMPSIPIRVEDISPKGDYGMDACFVVLKRHRTDNISICFNINASFYCSFGEWAIDVINIILHEMIHEYCYLNGIQDCDCNTQYHYAAFRDVAQKHGLVCRIEDEEYGYTCSPIGIRKSVAKCANSILISVSSFP